MKNVLIFIFLSVVSGLFAQASWTKQYTDTTLQLNAVHWVGKDTGTVVGSKGSILRTTNGGVSWTRTQYNANNDTGRLPNLQSVWMSSNNTAWICGADGLIAQQTNGGIPTKSFTSTTSILHDIMMEGTNSGWAVGGCGTVLRWTGSNWSSVNTGIQDHLLSLAIKNSNSIITAAFGNVPTGGTTSWQNTLYPSAEELYKIKQVGNTMLALGISDTIFKSTDKGNSWTKIKTPSRSMYALAMMNETEWLIAGKGGKVYRTTDSGTNWKDETPSSPGSTGSFKAIFANTAGQFYSLVNNNGEIWKVQFCTITATLTASNSTVCAGIPIVLKAKGGKTYSWKGSTATADSLMITPLQSSSYEVTVTDSIGCAASKSVDITVNPLPTISAGNDIVVCESIPSTIYSEPAKAINTKEKCNLIDFSFKVSFNVQGLNPPFKIIDANSGLQVGIVSTAPYSFTTNDLSTGTTYRYVVEDALGCKGDTLVGYRKCECETNADSMNVNTKVELSEGQSVTISGLGGFKNDGNDTQEYALHRGSGSKLIAPVLGVNKTGVFNFNPATMQYDVTYYVSAIAANQDANGKVFLNDQCLRVSPGQPVVWHKNTNNGASTVTLNATSTVNDYTWSNGQKTMTVQLDTMKKSYVVTAISAQGCKGYDTVLVQLLAKPIVKLNGQAGPLNGAVCSGKSLTVTASGGSSYLWPCKVNIPNYTISIPGNYVVTVTDSKGCKATESVIVGIGAGPSISGLKDTSFCSGKSVELNVMATNSTYKWSNNSTQSKISVNQIGNYTVTVTGTDGCTSTQTVSVGMKQSPQINLGTNLQLCEGTAYTLKANVANGADSYLWNLNNINTDTLRLASIASGTSTYTVSVTKAGCESAASVSVIGIKLPTVKINGKTSICLGESTELDGTNSGGVFTYLWENGSTSSKRTVSPLSTSKYFLTIDNQQCKNKDSIEIKVNTLPTISISPTKTNLCEGDTLSLFASGGSQFNWNTSNGGQANGNRLFFNTIALSNAKDYQVTATDGNGCKGVGTYSMIVKKAPYSELIGPLPRCYDGLGSSIELKSLNGNKFVWLNDTTKKETSLLYYGSVGKTMFSVKIDSTNGCSKTISFDLILKAVPNGKITGDSIICIGSSTTLTAEGGNTYLWLNNISQFSTQSVNPTTNTEYVVLVKNNEGCADTVRKLVQVHPLPNAVLQNLNLSICSDSVTIVGNNGLGYIGTWSGAYSKQDGLKNKIEKLPLGVHQFVWKVISTTCKNSPADSAILTVNRVDERPLARIDTGYITEPGKSITIDILKNDSTDHVVNLNIQLLDTTNGIWILNAQNQLEYMSTPLFGGYAKAVYRIFNEVCPDAYSDAIVRVLVNAPKLGGDDAELITPNGDGKNEGLEFEYLPNYPENEIVIFNRWGSEVYRAKPYKNAEAWTGKGKNGGDLPDGTYYYFLILESKTEGKKSVYGSVLLIR